MAITTSNSINVNAGRLPFFWLGFLILNLGFRTFAPRKIISRHKPLRWINQGHIATLPHQPQEGNEFTCPDY
jgi:hypothetical protein